MGGLSPFYLIHPKSFHESKEMTLWSLLQADCKGVSFLVEGVVNLEIGGVLGGSTPDVGGSVVGVVEGTPSTIEGSSKRLEDSQNSPPVENVNSRDEDFSARSSRKRNLDSSVNTGVVVSKLRNICHQLRRVSSQRS
ncbi:hypothetical protein Hanom_Chr11g01017061 [Helianthus anomalus]